MTDLSVAETIVRQILCLDQNAMNRWQVIGLSAGDRSINLVNLDANEKTGPIFNGFGAGGWLRLEVMNPEHRLFIGLNSGDRYDLVLIKTLKPKDLLLSLALLDKAEGIYFDQLIEVIDAMTQKVRALI